MTFQAGARQGRVGNNQAIQRVQSDFSGNIVEAGLGQVRGDFEKDGASRFRLRVSCIQYLAQQILKAVASLQIAKTRRVGRRNIDREIAGKILEFADTGDIIRNPVGAILVGADIDADNTLPFPPFREASQGGVMALIVETKPVYDGIVFDQPENTRLGIAALSQWRQRANLGKAEAKLQQGIRHLSILVVTCRHSERIGKVEPGNPNA